MTNEPEMRDVIAERTYHPYKELLPQFEQDGDVLVIDKGEYVGTSPNSFDEEKPNHAFRVDGREHILNYCGHLAYQMNQVAVGDLVTAIYQGQEVLKDGKFKGKKSHQWKIKVGKTNGLGQSADDNPFA